jgi:hypothetical protein
MDINLKGVDGTVLLQYGDDEESNSKGQWCVPSPSVPCDGVGSFVWRGMQVDFCVDACSVDYSYFSEGNPIIPAYAETRSPLEVAGDPSYSTEWVAVDETAQEILLSVVSVEKIEWEEEEEEEETALCCYDATS